MIRKVSKISIIGGSGTGKTTLANNLGKELHLPVYHIDGIHHLENWEIRDKDERDKIILEKVAENKWIKIRSSRTCNIFRLFFNFSGKRSSW